MSGIGSPLSQRLTLGRLGEELDIISDQNFSQEVTVTSLARSVNDVSPGSLFVPGDNESTPQALEEAVLHGAYAVLLKQEGEKDLTNLTSEKIGIPVLRTTNIEYKLGRISAYLENHPSTHMVVFVVEEENKHIAEQVASFLHLLGNPVGFLDRLGQSYSVSRPLLMEKPLDSVQLQERLSIMFEDGAAVAVICANPETLQNFALVGTHIDVCAPDTEGHSELDEYGAEYDTQTHVISDLSSIPKELLRLFPSSDDSTKLAIAMVLAAGITTDALEEAISISQEFRAIGARR